MDIELQIVLWVVGIIAVVVITGGFWLITVTIQIRTDVARLDERVKLLTRMYLTTANYPDELTDQKLLEFALDSDVS